jgi:hypothetical protein
MEKLGAAIPTANAPALAHSTKQSDDSSRSVIDPRQLAKTESTEMATARQHPDATLAPRTYSHAECFSTAR